MFDRGALPRLPAPWTPGVFRGLHRASVWVTMGDMELAPANVEGFMRDALATGRLALPGCLPNPPVGCVLVRGGVVIARGWTQAPYQPHAEPMALREVSGDLTDVTAFVTLEPCAFHQRTPSCARELIARRVGRVYVAMIDPHPRNQGRGIEMLREAGIPVETGVLGAEALADLGPYLAGAALPPVGW